MVARAYLPAHSALPAGLTSIGFNRFRNLRDQILPLDLAPVVLIGDNGAGKTNCLEAISFFAPGSGLRQAQMSEPESLMPRNDPGFSASWALHGKYQGRYGEFALGTGRDPEPGPRERRVSRINGAPVKSQSAFSEIFVLQWLTPKIARLFEESPSSRRRFLDRLVQGIDPSHGTRVTAYEEAMRGRNKLLEQYHASDIEQARWLSSLEQEMAGLAVAISAARAEMIGRLNNHLIAARGAFPKAYLRLEGEIDRRLQEEPALRIEDWLRESWAAARLEESRNGQSVYGAHKSDLTADYIGRQLAGSALNASLCSAGEQKALVLSILLSAARLSKEMRKEPPILLFDDIFLGLDEARRFSLLEELEELGSQVWLTGTEAALFDPWKAKAQFFHLENGRIGQSY